MIEEPMARPLDNTADRHVYDIDLSRNPKLDVLRRAFTDCVVMPTWQQSLDVGVEVP